jgi:hypothetical protein
VSWNRSPFHELKSNLGAKKGLVMVWMISPSLEMTKAKSHRREIKSALAA